MYQYRYGRNTQEVSFETLSWADRRIRGQATRETIVRSADHFSCFISCFISWQRVRTDVMMDMAMFVAVVQEGRGQSRWVRCLLDNVIIHMRTRLLLGVRGGGC